MSRSRRRCRSASGEPAGFEANTLALLQSLLLLEQGEVSISDDTVTLSGAPATEAVADAVRTTLTGLGGTATLEPPRVAEFALNIDKSATGLALSGFVPDTATKAKLAALPGADVSKLALGRGAPERFASGARFRPAGILDHLSDGQFSIKGSKLSIGGRAATVADFKATNDLVGQGAPQGLTLAASELHPPVAKPFTWSAVKPDTGMVSISGYVPDDATRERRSTPRSPISPPTAPILPTVRPTISPFPPARASTSSRCSIRARSASTAPIGRSTAMSTPRRRALPPTRPTRSQRCVRPAGATPCICPRPPAPRRCRSSHPMSGAPRRPPTVIAELHRLCAEQRLQELSQGPRRRRHRHDDSRRRRAGRFRHQRRGWPRCASGTR